MYPVSSTSALILLCTQESIYEGAAAKNFLKKVQLDSGQPLFQRLSEILPYADQEVTNRKFAVKKFANNFLASHPNSQVIFLAAGLDPKSLDVAEHFPQTSVFDVDMENMDVKAAINKEINGPQNVKFCQADITQTGQLLSALRQQGFNSQKTTLVVAEGITYYVSKDSFKNSVSKLVSSPGGLILEYSIPNEGIKNLERRTAYCQLFDGLQESLKMPHPLVRYSIEEVDTLASALGGQVETNLNQAQLEKERTGENQWFDQNEGAVHVSFISFPGS